MASFKRSILFLTLLALFVLFFMGGPDHYSPRSFQSFWNLGHIFFFSLIPLMFLSFKRIPNSFLFHCTLALATTMALGAAVELMQFNFQQRTPDMGDFFRDVIGAMVCIFFLLPSRKRISRGILLIMQVGTVVLVSSQILPVITALNDERIARNQFPLLSGFETPFEIQRWYAKRELKIDKNVKLTGVASMRVILDSKKYSGVELRYFPRNWVGFSYFQFSIYNPSAEDLSIVCRIHDDDPAETGLRYDDRFKRRYLIPSGWHTLTVDLEDVKHNPKNRLMDMHKITNVSFFTLGLPHPRVIYLDDVKLL